MTDQPVPAAEYVLSPDDHLRDMVIEALERFAREDNCTVAEWAGRAIRQVAVARLSGEAAYDGCDTLSAQRRTRIDGCDVQMHSSRMCERGTKSCVKQHARIDGSIASGAAHKNEDDA
jgi:hypothetical protein